MGKQTTAETPEAEAPAETSGKAKKAATITVYATCNLHEAGAFLKKGDSLETTPDRAAALGDCVTDKAPDA